MKLAICIPMYKHVPSETVVSLLSLQRYMSYFRKDANSEVLFADKFDEFEFITIDSCFVDQARNILADEAIRLNCDYVLWIDSDHLFVPLTIESFIRRYFKSGYDIVGARYNNRTVKGQPVAYTFSEEPDVPLMKPLEKKVVDECKGYYECDCIGMGMSFMPINILKEMKEKHHFIFRCKDYDGKIIGEDTYFFFNIKKQSKYKVALDCKITIGHIGGIV
jgi:hypothetical protein